MSNKLYELDNGEVDVDEAGVSEDGDEFEFDAPHEEFLFLTGNVLGMSGWGGGGGRGGSLASESHDSDELVDRVGELDMPESLYLSLGGSLTCAVSGKGGEPSGFLAGESKFCNGGSKIGGEGRESKLLEL